MEAKRNKKYEINKRQLKPHLKEAVICWQQLQKPKLEATHFNTNKQISVFLFLVSSKLYFVSFVLVLSRIRTWLCYENKLCLDFDPQPIIW